MKAPLDHNAMWKTILNQMEMEFSRGSYQMWLKDTYILKEVDGTVYLGVPSIFVREQLQRKFHHAILKSLRTHQDTIRSIEYTIVQEERRKRDQQSLAKRQAEVLNTTLPLEDHYHREDGLNPRYSFDSFVVGSFNELAKAATQAVLERPGTAYNPLYIYGPTGVGKTHLIQGLGNEIKKMHPNKKVIYISSDKFSQEIVQAYMGNKVNLFKEKYLKYDVFIMDDIQFVANREKTQEDLFHLFNTLHDNNRQIIFSSDQHPNFMVGLEDRLRSRFNSGMIVDIPKPDLESRIAILRAKANAQNVEIPFEVLEFIAKEVDSNIRELEGVINTVVMSVSVKKVPPTIQNVKNLLKTNAKPKRVIAIKDVVKLISQFYNTDENSIYEKNRKKEVVKPRQVIMYILREDFSISLPTIGEKLGGRDHTTVIHSCEKIREEITRNPMLLEEIGQIRQMFN